MSNKHIVLIVAKPSSGKTYSLRSLKNPKSVALFNCDRKSTPFKNDFSVDLDIGNPKDILDYIDQCESNPNIKTIVLDTVTYLMRTFKIKFIDESSDSRSAWGDYQKFYNKLMDKIKGGKKNYIVMAHITDVYNEEDEVYESQVVMQGAIAKLGIQGDYATVLEAISKPVNKKLKGLENDLMKITDQEELIGIKYLFLTRRMKGHLSTMARSASDLWDMKELYIDNNIQNVIDRLEEYYD